MTSQWLRPFLFTLLILVAPLTAYYLHFVQSRESFLLDRLHAHLSNMAARVDDRFDSAFNIIQTNFGNANDLGIPEGRRCKPGADLKRVVVQKRRDWLNFDTGGCGKDGVEVAASDIVGDVDPTGQFYDILILAGDRVVFQRNAEQGRFGDGVFPAAAAGDDKASRTVTDPLAQLRWDYHGQQFLVFRAPLAVATEGGGTLTIVGLLEQARFNRLKYAIHPAGIALLALIVLGFLFAGPFLKLWYLGRFEPLTRFDIFLQTAAGLSLVATVTVALLAWNTAARLERYFDARLTGVTEALRDSIGREFSEAVEALYDLEPKMVAAYAMRHPLRDQHFAADAGDCPTMALGYDDPTRSPMAARLPTEMGTLFTTEIGAVVQPYRQLKMAYLMDQNGCQVVKWASESKWSQPGRFADRPYFLRPLPDGRQPPRLYQFYGSNRSFFQEVIVSRTTGERSMVFSKPVGGSSLGRCARALRSGDPSRRVPCVSVVTAGLRSLDAILPEGYGAVLVDGDLDILLRNGGAPSAELNLAHEIDKPERLAALINAAYEGRGAATAYLDAEYRRAPHRFQVAPISLDIVAGGRGGFVPRADRLTLVTFYDRNAVSTPVLEAVGAAAAAWLIAISVLGTLFLLFWIADDISERELRRRPAYLFIAIAVLVASAGPGSGSTRRCWRRCWAFPCRCSVCAISARTKVMDQSSSTTGIGGAGDLAVGDARGGATHEGLLRRRRAARRRRLVRNQAEASAQAAEARQQSFDDWKYQVGLGADMHWTGFAAWRDQPFYPGDRVCRPACPTAA